MTQLFTNDCQGYPKLHAQRNLIGRTHYVNDDTLRFHKSKILASYVVDCGLLFALVESCALDMDNTRRGFRYVVFNVFGHVISRVDLEDCFGTKAAATKAMWAWLNECDAKTETLEALERVERRHAQEMAELRGKLIDKAA